MPIKNFVIGQRVSPEKRERAKQLRRDATPAENRLWQRLRGNRLNGLHFRRQHVIAGYIVDFYCHARALIIEVDGPIHASRVEEDAQREQHLRRHGFRIIRFSNEEVLEHTEKVIADIREACEVPNPLLSPKREEKGPGDERGLPAHRQLLEDVYHRVDFDRELVFRFFTEFSLFEYALKEANFLVPNIDEANPDWDEFARVINGQILPTTDELREAVDYLLNHPPTKQISQNGHISFRNAPVQDQRIAVRLSVYIRRVRNNLFHGGKFIYDRDRDTLLIRHSLVILEAWATCHPAVEQALHLIR